MLQIIIGFFLISILVSLLQFIKERVGNDVYNFFLFIICVSILIIICIALFKIGAFIFNL
ncbi:hypothetical protein B9N60_06805 [Campylobacter concisus]|uniref:Uncharacterized protein n=1 Tax=Campylobacter concisus TaxID=199 RepID=A0A1Y5N9F3_9BACT|nr:hypothetical protein B9N60_06805 [Campylobacter concisus]